MVEPSLDLSSLLPRECSGLGWTCIGMRLPPTVDLRPPRGELRLRKRVGEPEGDEVERAFLPPVRKVTPTNVQRLAAIEKALVERHPPRLPRCLPGGKWPKIPSSAGRCGRVLGCSGRKRRGPKLKTSATLARVIPARSVEPSDGRRSLCQSTHRLRGIVGSACSECRLEVRPRLPRRLPEASGRRLYLRREGVDGCSGVAVGCVRAEVGNFGHLKTSATCTDRT